MNSKKIKIFPYNPNWPIQFKKESDKIREALGGTCLDIYHIGSTSIPSLAAKEDIDILLVIDKLKNSLLIEKINYIFKGELNIPLRYFFSKNTNESKVNLHVVEKDHSFIDLQLRFRDYLCKNPEVRDEYAALKYKLLQDKDSHKKIGPIFTGYTLGKHEFIQNILKKTGFEDLRFVICTHSAEWLAAKHFRNKYFSRSNKIEDPYSWTFDHKDHKHLILYKGVNIIGYVHVQLMTENRASYLRIIVIDKKEQGKGYGKEFMSLIEKWLGLEEYQNIHISVGNPSFVL